MARESDESTESNALGTDLEPCSTDPLDPGDRWCLCLGRWVEAVEEGVAPPVVLEATNEAVLEEVPFSTLVAHEYDGDADVAVG